MYGTKHLNGLIARQTKTGRSNFGNLKALSIQKVSAEIEAFRAVASNMADEARNIKTLTDGLATPDTLCPRSVRPRVNTATPHAAEKLLLFNLLRSSFGPIQRLARLPTVVPEITQ